jgi:Tfp pilus assembly protein PilX
MLPPIGTSTFRRNKSLASRSGEISSTSISFRRIAAITASQSSVFAELIVGGRKPIRADAANWFRITTAAAKRSASALRRDPGATAWQ